MRKQLKEEKELRSLIAKRWSLTNRGAPNLVISRAITAFCRAVIKECAKEADLYLMSSTNVDDPYAMGVGNAAKRIAAAIRKLR